MVATFGSSDRLGAAYGLAVTVTMLAVKITYCAVARKRWHWPWWRVALIGVLFLSFDISFLVGNLPKLLAGGWVPVAIAVVVFTFFTTWVEGRRRFAKAYAALAALHDPVADGFRNRTPEPRLGTAIVLTPTASGTPAALRHDWLRRELQHQFIVLLTIVPERHPYVTETARITTEALAPGIVRVMAHYGFMETPNIKQIMMSCKRDMDGFPLRDPVYYFLARARVTPATGPGAMWPWQRGLYALMLSSARPFTDSLGLPADKIIEFGIAIPV
jgi:KUP system potassium uptake protein